MHVSWMMLQKQGALIHYLNVETWLLFVPLSKFLATCLTVSGFENLHFS